ncbi:MAG: hypothetical protein HYV25_00345 [Candidatus Harrisonbacteria bacterium]|nr:hypothetical protein [Candidatus Harrisonbacteria bacterium]
MRIAATDEFGTFTWEMDPEVSARYHKFIAETEKIAGEEAARDFDRALVEQIQAVFKVAVWSARGAICAPHLALILISTLRNGMGAATEANLALIKAEKDNIK